MTDINLSEMNSDTAPAVSEDYSDVIFANRDFSDAPALVSGFYEQPLNEQYTIYYLPLSAGFSTVRTLGYANMPKLFTFINTTSLEQSGILSVQNQPFLNLQGRGILVGFLDSGIDYTLPAFRKPDGTTRILGLWDQTIQTGPTPDGLSYGTEYTEADFNQALQTPEPIMIVPEQDEQGHGTAVAGIACGSPDPENEFVGAAPMSSILFVRLKPAKRYLRDYFLIPETAVVYQENDLMLGIRYLTDTAKRLDLPLVICMSLGTNQGGHTGNTPLENVLTAAQFSTGIYALTGTGNEVGRGHHFFKASTAQRETTDIEILVDETTNGFTIEFWADSLELYSIGFISPLGETVEPVYPGPIKFRRFTFLLEPTEITYFYSVIEMVSGLQLALIRFIRPTPGIWKLRIINQVFAGGSFHVWLPIHGMITPGIRFLSPDPDTTLVTPSCAEALISTSTYDAATDSIYAPSGRGYTRNNRIKPDFAAPGVGLTAPAPGGRYIALTGSSAATALASGSAALIAEWGIQRYQRFLTAAEIKNLFLRGATRSRIYTYPNREWGYGAMDVYGIFEALSGS